MMAGFSLSAYAGDKTEKDTEQKETIVSVSELESMPVEPLKNDNIQGVGKPAIIKVVSAPSTNLSGLAKQGVTLKPWNQEAALYIGPSRSDEKKVHSYQPAAARSALHPEGRFVEPMESIAEAGVRFKF